MPPLDLTVTGATGATCTRAGPKQNVHDFFLRVTQASQPKASRALAKGKVSTKGKRTFETCFVSLTSNYCFNNNNDLKMTFLLIVCLSILERA